MRPAESTACRVELDKHDLSWFVLYAGRAAAPSTSSMVDTPRNIFHLSSHTANESRSASRSKGGGEPYGLNALAGLAAAAAGAAMVGNHVFLWPVLLLAATWGSYNSGMQRTAGNSVTDVVN